MDVIVAAGFLSRILTCLSFNKVPFIGSALPACSSELSSKHIGCQNLLFLPDNTVNKCLYLFSLSSRISCTFSNHSQS
jgi:hypothetical protein